MNVPYYSPTQNIEINNLKASIGDNFELWADDYFLEDKLNTYLNKNEVYNDCKRTLPLSSPRVFKQKMQDYCKLKGYVFNPKELQNYKDGRIMHKAYINTPYGQNRVTIEKLYLQTSEPKTETANTLPTEIEDTDLEDITKDIPF